MESEALVDILAEAVAGSDAARPAEGNRARGGVADALSNDLTMAVIAIGLALTDPQLTLRTRTHLRQAETALLAADRRVRQLILAEPSARPH